MNKIHCSDYKLLADYIYDGDGRELPSQNCVVYVPMDNIAEFFREAERNTKNSYVVVSACSDYSIQYQHAHPVGVDMLKWLKMAPYPEFGYDALVMPPRCRPEFCKITDKYSVKVYSFTKDTFDRIPENVLAWMATNVNINDDRVYRIPFGIPDWTYDLIDQVDAGERQTRIYVNFQSNTLERHALKSMLKPYDPRIILVTDEVSKEEYIRDLKESKFVLCPPGNGLDSYRVLEAIYCGAIPVLQKDRWSGVYTELPVVYLDNINIYPNELWYQVLHQGEELHQTRLDTADFDHYKNLLTDLKELYL